MAINSKQKGAAGEREFAKFIREKFNVFARRGQQFSGSVDSPDVCTDFDGVHFEVKRTERINVYAFMEQAKRDCGGKIPVVACRSNRKDWLLIINASDLKQFCLNVMGSLWNKTQKNGICGDEKD